MANHASSKKRIRQIERRTAVNRTRMTSVRTAVKKVEQAITAGDQAVAQSAFREMQPQLQRCITKGLLKSNTVSRKISRMNARVKAMSA